jgi:hypothetical protein
VPKWAGIGAVRYVPDYLLDKLEDINVYLEKNKTKEIENKVSLFYKFII